VTEARPGLSADIRYRERRYLIMMGIRTLCFVAAVLMFVNHLGWLTAIPAVGALVIPYFAVVFANAGREPAGRRTFRQYEPNSPAIYKPPTGPGSPPSPPDE
jgi:CHASE2 domain-containing sensor protein